MASLNIITLSILAIIIGYAVNADVCKKTCGYIGPETIALPNESCAVTGFTGNYSHTIYWDDGSYSVYSVNVVTRLAIGSCCTALRYSNYNTGIVTSGRFSGANVVVVYKYRNGKQQCSANGCQSSAALSTVIGEEMISIGTKGVGNWIECTGTTTQIYYPGITSTPQPLYSTFSVVFDSCSNCMESSC